MKSCITNSVLICCISLLVTGWTTTEKTPTDGAETVGSDGNITSAGGETPAPQSESPTGDIQDRTVPLLAPGGMPPKLAPRPVFSLLTRPTTLQTAPSKPILTTPPTTPHSISFGYSLIC